ncbi:hypothetical protein GCM10027037_04500 [Mucilaginibacter koreensis]
MKKFTYLFVLLLTTAVFSAHAQIQKGNVMLGGDLADVRLGLDNSKVFSFSVSPKAAWFIQDNVALGGYVNLGVATAKNTNTTFTYGVGGLGRYYAGSDAPLLRHGRLFGEANIGIGGVNVSNGGGNTNGLDFGFGPGFAYFVTPSVGLETLLKYNGVGGFGNAGYQSTLTLNFGLQVYLSGRGTANKIKSDIR